ncbi:ficolin-1-like [Ochlerotatus camptorhynchus]|uniref:ficolin-1-like n=1 Tax=Ochlerotatus camptorhynchus TaxID=644619 RepID=UPI0031D273FB
MSGVLLISSILVLVLKSSFALCGAMNQGFGYEILVTKIETQEERFTKLSRTLQNSTTSIMSELNSLRDLIKSQQNSLQNVYDSCDKVPSKMSGVFNVQLNPQETARVYCDQNYDGGGWTVIQWRFDGSTNFYRGWTEYKRGFGNLNGGEFWLGLDIIHQLTYSGPHEMVILLEDFEGNSTYAKLDRFEMAGEEVVYKVTMADGYSGTAGDSISGIKNNMFSTFDKDSDTYPGNCASEYHGAWWYSKCHSSNLNGKYSKGQTSEYATGMVWNAFRGYHYALKSSKMMIRKKK